MERCFDCASLVALDVGAITSSALVARDGLSPSELLTKNPLLNPLRVDLDCEFLLHKDFRALWEQNVYGIPPQVN